jgi:hypothetical protein
MTILVNTINPDKKAIDDKQQISITLSVSDISSSMSLPPLSDRLSDIRLNSTNQRVTFQIQPSDQEDETQDSLIGLYYTPIYSEQISYSEWKRTVDKRFQELEVVDNG